MPINWGRIILKRPKKLASDKSPSEDSLLHFAKKVDFDVIVFIQPTSPLITSYDINNALEILNQGYDSVVSFYKIKNFIWNENRPFYNPKSRPMRQEKRQNILQKMELYILLKKNH